MHSRIIVVTVLAVLSTGLSAAEPRLENERELFPAGATPICRVPTDERLLSMRLDPQGRYLLYLRVVEPTAQQIAASLREEDPQARDEAIERLAALESLPGALLDQAARAGHGEAVMAAWRRHRELHPHGSSSLALAVPARLRRLEDGQDIPLPIPPLHWPHRSGLTRFDYFAPSGMHLLVPHTRVEHTSATAEYAGTITIADLHWLLYDVDADTTTLVEADVQFGWRTTVDMRFAFNGTAIVAASGRGQKVIPVPSLPGPLPRRGTLHAPGDINSVCPTEPIASFYQFKQEGQLFVLWDLQRDIEVARLPIHVSSDVAWWQAQWTADGRYLYYPDREDVPAERPGAPPGTRRVTRIWDRQAGRVVGTLPEVMPAGAAGGPTRMLLGRRTGEGEGGFLLHDAADGTEYPLASGGRMLICVGGGKVVWAEKDPSLHTDRFYVADLVVPEQ